MKLLPLVLHAALQLPRWTGLFSETLDVATLGVVAGGTMTFTSSAAHGVPVGQAIALSVTDAEAPNAITAATVDADGNIVCTTAFPHTLSASPDPTRFRAWDGFAKVAGFTSSDINGVRQLVATPTETTFVITPGAEVVGVTLTGDEKLFERLELGVIGWHKVVAATATTLTVATPQSVTRSFTVTAPTVVRQIRVAGAIDHEEAVRRYVEDGDLTTLNRGYMFVLPSRVHAKGKPTTALAPGADYRLRVDDGFTLLVFLPSTSPAAHVAAIDKAQGEIFRAVLQTYHGLKVLRSELCLQSPYIATFVSHQGGMHRNNAIYAHEYVFEAPFELVNDDALAPWNWTVLDDGALSDGTTPDSIGSEGTAPWGDLDLTGILHKGHPGALLGTFKIDVGDE